MMIILYLFSPSILFAQGNVTHPHIISTTHPDSTQWYAERRITFLWDLPSSVTAVRTLYDTKATSVPNKIYNPPIKERSIQVDEEGVLYFHLQFKEGDLWGPIAHYKFQIDSERPTNVNVRFPDGTTTYSPTPAVLITATDMVSGIHIIEMSVDGEEAMRVPFDSSNLYHLPKAMPGRHTARIAVYDKAGNKSETETVEYVIQTLGPPQIVSYTKHVEGTEPLVVSGKAYSNTYVEVALTDEYENTLTQTTLSNAEGEFTLTWDDDLEKGVYELRARVVDPNGAVSDPTEVKIVKVENIALIRIGLFVMNWLSLVLVSIMAAFAVAAVFWYSLVQFGRFRRKVKRTMQEAENTLKTNVQALRRDTEEFHTVLVKASKKRDLTKEETAIMKKFKKRLDITEKEIEEKLETLG